MKNSFSFKTVKKATWLVGLSLSALAVVNCTTDKTIDLDEGNLESTSSNNLSSKSVEIGVSSISASTQQSANPASNAIDNSSSSRWSGFGTAVNLNLDLGSTANIDYIKVAFFKGNERKAKFKVFVSSNNSNWSQINSKTSSGSTTGLQTFDLSNSSARYLRLQCNGNSNNNWNSITDLQVWGSGGGPVDNGGGDTPYDVLGLDRWKITLPKDDGGDSDADEVYYDADDNDHTPDGSIRDYSDEFFYVNSSGNVIFSCPADDDLPKTSSGTSNTRTELREMPYRSGNEDGWDAGGSTVREMSMRVRVLQTSSTRKLAFAQVHDYERSNWDDLIRIQIQSDDSKATVGDYGKIYIMGDMAEGLSSEGVSSQSDDDRIILENYRLGDWMDIRVTYNNDTIRIYLNGNEVQEYSGADCPSNYFKAGCYNQSMSSSSSGTGIVEIQSLSVSSNF